MAENVRKPTKFTGVYQLESSLKRFGGKPDIGRELVLRMWGSLSFSAGASGTMVGNYLTLQGSSLDTDVTMLKTLEIRP